MANSGDDNKKDGNNEPQDKGTPIKKCSGPSPTRVTKRRHAIDSREYDDDDVDLNFSFIPQRKTIRQATEKFEVFKRKVELKYDKNSAGSSSFQQKRETESKKDPAQQRKTDGGEEKQVKKEQQEKDTREKNEDSGGY